MEAQASLIARVVAWSSRWAIVVVAATLAASVVAGAYVSQHFSIHTELAALIPPDVPWQRHEKIFARAFAEQGDEITLVIDGRTPELAEAAAAKLDAALSARGDLFISVERLNGGPFFDREGVLFLDEPQVRATSEALIRAQPLLAPVAADPSLRGVLTSLTTAAEAVTAGQASPDAMSRPLAAIARTAGEVEQGRPAYFAWRPLVTGRAVTPEEARQFVELIPRLDYGQANPGEAALDAVRQAASRLGVDEAHGVKLRTTGSVAMENDELSTLEEATGPIALATLAIVITVLWFALRSARIVGAVLVTVLAGLALTSAFGLLVYGRFNLISVAFLPLFVGLGIDFAIQFSVRYRAEALTEPDIPAALAKAGAGAGRGLTLAAAATGLGFFAFLPTRYSGFSELGLIAGVGMGVAYALCLSFLPALLTLLRARSPAEEVGLPGLRDADSWVSRRRRPILAAAAILGLLAIALALTPGLKVNFDPVRLRNPASESVATFLELARNPDTNPNTLDVLTPDLGAARALAARLSRLPQVGRVLTLDSLVPGDQAPKLALLQDAALLLDPTVNPFDVAPPPSDADLVRSLRTTTAALRALAATPAAGPIRPDATRLAGLLQAAADGSPGLRARLQATLTAGLPVALGQVRAMLAAQPVSVDTLPPDLKEDWVAADGRARVEIYPAGDPQDAKTVVRFVAAVQRLAPTALGTPVAVGETQRLILGAFAQAAALSLAAIVLLLLVVLRSLRAVILTIAPVLLSGLLTVGTCVLLGQDINLENLIALPLLLGIGVSFNIYFVVAWSRGERALLRSSLTRAVLYSALTTGLAFSALSLSRHPGTASMGVLLLISLVWILVASLIVEPALLAAAEPPGDPRRR
ncbi:MAG: hopanoid biosynthesis-associated transporter HpnN [Phenylobacterium sp.]|nr:hopanoid biosynthesis-associated transporter HpnN [Phenylobacterium sp.]